MSCRSWAAGESTCDGSRQAEPFPDAAPFLDAAEDMSVDELRALQLERLKWSIGHAFAHVPHVRAAFAAAGVRPEDLRELDDLARFPFTTKSDLRDHYPFGLFAVPRAELRRVHASSGTTGRPTVVAYTARDLATWAGLAARSLRAAGVRAGDLVHVAYGYGLFTGGLGVHYGAEHLGCTVVPMSAGNTEKQVQLICDFRPDVLLSTPSYALAIADEFARQGRDARDCALRIGSFGGEPWTEAMRDELERTFAIDAVDMYGLSEIMGPGVAGEHVERKDGATIWEDHFYPEIIDPETGRVLPDGEDGELVLTTLTKEALPLIRYRTRDRSRLLAPSLGSMRRMSRVLARTDDMLIIRGVNVFPSQIEELVLRIPHLAPHFLLEVWREAHLDVLRICVEAAPGTPLDGEGRERTARELQRLARAVIGLNVQVGVGEPNSIERSSGKARRIRDRR